MKLLTGILIVLFTSLNIAQLKYPEAKKVETVDNYHGTIAVSYTHLTLPTSDLV